MESSQLEHHVERPERVTPLELFFDLVFVFAFTQVTVLMARDPTWQGMGHGMLVLAALWWAWAAYAWLTGTVNPEEGATRLAVFVVMGGMLIAALAAPKAFGSTALLFAVAYSVVRVMHLALFALASRKTADADLLKAVIGLVPSATIGPALLLVAAAFQGVVQEAIWALALAIDFGGPVVRGMEGWRVSPSHFAERHGLIVIIALGESIAAVGVGAAGVRVDFSVVVVASLGLIVSAVLWWAYFDVVAINAERRLTETRGVEQAELARDAYSYIHLAMIAGIILFSLGAKKSLGRIDAPLETIPGVAMCGGVALYFLAHLAFRLRNVGTLSVQRAVAAGALLALIPVAINANAIVSLAGVAAVCVALISYEALRFAEFRASVRGSAAGPLTPP